MNRIGILAGNGRYPVLLANRLADRGVLTAVAGLRGQTRRDRFPKRIPYRELPLGAFRHTAAFFSAQHTTHIFFAGGVNRAAAWRYLRPDTSALRAAADAVLRGDDRLLRTAANAFHRLGVSVADPAPWIDDWLATPGHLAGPPPTPEQLSDIETARAAALSWGAADRGQAAVAYRDKVLGCEGRFGTDALMRRRGTSGAVLVKAAKPGQDRRFDLPAVGERTVAVAHRSGIAALGVEAGAVLLLDKPRLFAACDRAGIPLWGFPAPQRR